MQTANSNDGEAGRERVKEGERKRKRGSVYSGGKIVKDKKEEGAGGGSEGKRKKERGRIRALDCSTVSIRACMSRE